VIPVVTAEQMRRADAAATMDAPDPAEAHRTLVERAGAATARAALSMMGGGYGRRVVVLAGPGNNGADGRVAARRLEERGCAVRVVDAADAAELVVDPRRCDLVVDAAFGTGFRGSWEPPTVLDVPVLAVDVPSGLDCDTGEPRGTVLPAERTVTFAALKPGHLFGSGPSLCGEVELVDIGLDVVSLVEDLDVFLVEPADVAAWLPPRPRDSHKWRTAVRVVAGSDAMSGASALVSASAMRAGAGIVHLSSRVAHGTAVNVPTEVVHRPLPQRSWADAIAEDIGRFASLVVGPGLGRGDDVTGEVRELLRRTTLPTVVDGDGLVAVVGTHGEASAIAGRDCRAVLTPHDGEFASLGGGHGADRIAATRELAGRLDAVVLRKGPTTVVAPPVGPVFLAASGDERLATAGSGDVLAGVIGAFLARGLAPLPAAAAAAVVHGLAVGSCPDSGVIARDLVGGVADVIARLSAVHRHPDAEGGPS
jgi:NAD(P)H-hydrate epimerase